MYKHFKKSLFFAVVMSLTGLMSPVFAMDNDDLRGHVIIHQTPPRGLVEEWGYLKLLQTGLSAGKFVAKVTGYKGVESLIDYVTPYVTIVAGASDVVDGIKEIDTGKGKIKVLVGIGEIYMGSRDIKKNSSSRNNTNVVIDQSIDVNTLENGNLHKLDL